ncbi:hypothetical protein RCH09_001623 [Actimicrobium sp. GrIS 1.19]|uniref:hypothetical protein n=1 Tax=Actimicrobium sp. GrIS 1.19 TaxID=3071708 RepID=UPI002DF7436C|nr:hypothetical protein [Actimicrobium sp. GrIS 1.19]
MKNLKLIPALLVALLSASAFAQTAATEVQRDINQQTRIENGLKSGQLNTREAARLQGEEARVERTEANAMKDGKLSAAEKARIQGMQNKVSGDIRAQKTDAQTGNPNSASSQRMQADTQRNINQQQRIENGVKDGSLTKREAAKLERGQAKDSRIEARAGVDGHVGANEQARIQHNENRQSKRIARQRHDAQVKG